ncbi:hypothetical protein PCK1_001505 [Pneumocystis canis]|nr:hypothetical protein PCK1_001505 [Pneumocystis canis]
MEIITYSTTMTVTDTMCTASCRDCTFILTSNVWMTETTTHTKTETYTKTTMHESLTMYTNQTAITFTVTSTLGSESICTSKQLSSSTQSISDETDEQVIIPSGAPMIIAFSVILSYFFITLFI